MIVTFVGRAALGLVVAVVGGAAAWFVLAVAVVLTLGDSSTGVVVLQYGLLIVAAVIAIVTIAVTLLMWRWAYTGWRKGDS